MTTTQARIKLYEAKRAQYFNSMQTTFNFLKDLKSKKNRQSFMAQAQLAEKWRSVYIEIVDAINLLQLEVNPEYSVNYQSLSAFEEMYAHVIRNYVKFEKPVPPPSIAVSAETSKKKGMKVPHIEIPFFDGDIKNFPFFYETFKRVIHDNEDLTDSERVHYLFSHLTGRAKEVCAGVAPAAGNYESTWNGLIKKYQDKRALATSYFNQMFSMKPLSASPSACNLEKFIDRYVALISAIKQLGISDLGDFILVYMGLNLLDADTAKCFESSIRNDADMPEYNSFIEFVQQHVKVLQRSAQRSHNAPITVERTNKTRTSIAPPRVPQTYVGTQSKSQAPKGKCVLCEGTHPQLYTCNRFLQFSPSERFSFVKEHKLCTNCLSSQHGAYKCNSRSSCRKCRGRHHSLLHFNNAQASGNTPALQHTAADHSGGNSITDSPVVNNASSSNETNPQHSSCNVASTSSTRSTEILATARVFAVGRGGKDVNIRCILDPGSQRHYVTTRCCTLLGLPLHSTSLTTVQGIGGSPQPIKGKVDVTFRSRFDNSSQYTIEALVLPQITCELPTCRVDPSIIESFNNISIADDTWATPGDIDLLIGVQLFAELLRPGKIVNPPGIPDALETVLGYIILGDAPTKSHHDSSLSFCSTASFEVESLIRKFWEVEEIESAPPLSVEDKYCQEFYSKTTTRDSTGRYEVALPFKADPKGLLGRSYNVAKRRLLTLERKFETTPKLKLLYDDVIREYIDKSYISLVDNVNVCSDGQYFIPHHGVYREDKSTTKLRVVLDPSSSKTDTGLALNDVLHTGPSLQPELFTLLLNMRLFPIAISADVRQHYLQISVRQQDRPYQRILYRFNCNEPIQVYEFNRVAFGLRTSPFLAIRTIHQLAADDGARFPLAQEISTRDTYVDDIVSSLQDPSQAVAAAHQLISLFHNGGFQLVKWSSNSKKVLSEIPDSLRLEQSIEFDKEATLKILGLCWLPNEDTFVFKVVPDERPCTKRNMLSSIARLFDVLGLVAPVVLYAKLLIKELWLQKIGWDEVPSQRIVDLWKRFQTELPLITQMKFPRHIGVANHCSVVIIGFADASEAGYGGVIYAHVTSENNVSVTLICAKSKVAPLKVVSLARLELCAALLLATLIKKVVDTYSARFKIDAVFAFSDSTVTLNWIKSSPHRWHTFVANRVAKIQLLLSPERFFHVRGDENPSDCLSRGLSPAQLIDHPLWLQGPPWAKLSISEWPIHPFVSSQDSELPEIKPVIVSLPVNINAAHSDAAVKSFYYELSLRYSSWRKLRRIVCYILKMCKKLPRGPITSLDVTESEHEIIRSVQQIHFSKDLHNLNHGKNCSTTIQQLKPFIKNGIIRVGGRLSNSDVSFDYQHPILLPTRDHVTDLIVDHYHQLYLHTGPELLMSILRQQYWIIAARRIIRQRIHSCNLCFRSKPRPTFPIMADLPSSRVTSVEKAFTHSGCDYAGPIYCTPTRGRGIRSKKAYICVFTCLTTRAVHIELATDMTTVSFLAAFKRFLSRRGPIKCLYTDHGTNYIGARTYMRELYDFLSKEYKEYYFNELSEHRIEWKMIPPNAPHFGGCWESTVKSIKTHLFKVIGQQILSQEELITVLTQIEALLNSRPLTALSSDPSEPTALTPAHFLNTTPLKHLPSHEVTNRVVHLLPRHELLDLLVQSFWKRWRNEYLHTLQVRQKWNTPAYPVKENTLVVVMQDGPSLYWPLGIITKTFPGKDGVVRVATVKTKHGLIKRPIVKLCPLPTQ